MNPRRDYQNDVRLSLTATNVVEIRAAYTNFIQGVAKICALPEYFPGEIKGEFSGNALYVELMRNAGNVEIAAFRHFAAGSLGRTNIGPTNVCAYVNGQGVSLQIGVTNLAIYYGSSVVTNVPHGLTNVVDVFSHGFYPHYEFLNASNTTTATVQMKALKCRTRSGFGMTE